MSRCPYQIYLHGPSTCVIYYTQVKPITKKMLPLSPPHCATCLSLKYDEHLKN